MNARSLSLALLLAAFIPSSASPSVVPNAFAATPASNEVLLPFDLGACGVHGIRYQQLYDGAEVGSGEIEAIGFRVSSSPGDAFQPVVVAGVTVRLAARPLLSEDFSEDLDENLGGGAEVVYSDDLILASSSVTVPRAFDITIPLDQPYAFDPTTGDDLIMDIRVDTCARLSRGFDYVTNSPAVARAFVSNVGANHATARSEGQGLVTQFVMSGGASACTPGPSTLCLDDTPGDGRFRVQVDYRTVQGGGSHGAAHAQPLAPLGITRGGVFWFFSVDNPELLIKVLNGCGMNGHYWIFWSAGTNVELTIRVDDLLSGQSWTDHNPDLLAAAPVQDTSALPCD